MTSADWYRQSLDRLPQVRGEYDAEVGRLCAHLDRLTPAVLGRLRTLDVRCPVASCRLATVYRIAQGEGERYVVRGRARSGQGRDGILNWAFPDDRVLVYWIASCGHGRANLERGWLLDLVGAVRGWRHALETEGQFLASLPPEVGKGRRSGVFHPSGVSWVPR